MEHAENPQNTRKKNTWNTCRIHIKIHAIYFHRVGLYFKDIFEYLEAQEYLDIDDFLDI